GASHEDCSQYIALSPRCFYLSYQAIHPFAPISVFKMISLPPGSLAVFDFNQHRASVVNSLLMRFEHRYTAVKGDQSEGTGTGL
ncbi:MAG TPA: hypothetical protein VMN99_10030, partial [Anaerolineales bacterium]|nr:hypothetical protein [Anaerolineales bacterium]